MGGEGDINMMEWEATGGLWNPYHSPCIRKSFSDCVEDQLSLVNSVHLCLTVMNTILTVIHALRPSSSTHSLQIYCTALTGPRSHTSWAWAEKHNPTIGAIYGKSLCVSECNGQSWWDQTPISKSPSRRPFWRWCKLHESFPIISKNTLSLS